MKTTPRQLFLNADYTNVGAKFMQNHPAMVGRMARMEFEPIIDGMSLPICPGMALKNFIREFRVPKADLYSISREPFGTEEDPEAAYCLMAVQGNYKNGTYRLFFVDGGDCLTPVCGVKMNPENQA
jgi:hypothetical protein